MSSIMVKKVQSNLLRQFHYSIKGALWRGKKKKANKFKQYRKRNDSEEVAREYFDTNYSKIFKSDWPSIRCAMLSRKKYCCVLNNFAETSSYENTLLESGAYNFISKLRNNAKLKYLSLLSQVNTNGLNVQQNELHYDEIVHNEKSIELESLESHFFETEKLEEDSATFKALERTCVGVRAYVYPKGNFTEFEEPMKHPHHQSFFLDASSFLPVLALDPRSGDSVLDLCSAPGGKLNIIVQAIGNTGKIVANDFVSNRTKKLKESFAQYIPSSFNQIVKFKTKDGTTWSEDEGPYFTKVLVDVPCTADRLSIYVPENDYHSIFSINRKKERLQLPSLQTQLLMNGVLSCQPGGHIVYSTATFSPIQNQYVVQFAVQELLQKHGVVCEVENLSHLTDLLNEEFHFQKDIELGVLAVPYLDANFGPTYMCKLRRCN